MSFVSRGFRGRRRDPDADPSRVPPGQYVTDDFPVLSAGPTPHTPTEEWTFSIVERRGAYDLDAGRSSAPCRARKSRSTSTASRAGRSSTPTWEGVSVDTLLERGRGRGALRPRLLRRRLHDQPAARGRHGRQGVGRLRLRRRAARPGARRPGAPARAAPLLLEERQVGTGPRAAGGGRAQASGRPTATTSTVTRGANSGTRATELAGGRRRRRRRRDADRAHDRPRRPRLGRTPRRTAPGRPPDRRGRVPGRARVFDRVCTGRAGRDHGRAAGRRRGVAVPHRGATGGRRLELRGPVGGYFVWDVEHGGPLLLVAGGSGIVPLRSMLRHRCRSDSDVPVRLLYSARTIEDVIYHAELDEPADGVDVVYTLTRRQPPGLDGPRSARRRGVAGGARVAADDRPLAYVCGPTSFVETVASGLVELGYARVG